MSNQLDGRTEGFAEAAHIVPGMLDHGDDRIPAGIHWRIVPGRNRLPLGPTVVRDWPNRPDMRRAPVFTDRQELPTAVTPESPLTITVTRQTDRMAGWMLVHGAGRLRVSVVAPTLAPNGTPIEITARDQEPWLVASADIEQVQVTGEGRVDEIVVWDTTRDALETLGRDSILDFASLDIGLAEAVDLYALPLAGAETPEDRVRRAAPTRPVPYSPQQPWPGWTDDDELARVAELVGRADSVVDWLRIAFEATAKGQPAGARLQQKIGGEQTIRYPALAALGVASADPGVARWLARCGMFEQPSPRWGLGEPAMAVAMVPVLTLVTRLPFIQPPRVLNPAEELYDEVLGGGYRALLDRVTRIPVPPPLLLDLQPGDAGGFPHGRIRRGQTVWEVDLLQLPMPLFLESVPAIPPAPRIRRLGDPAWVMSDAVRGPDAGRTIGWEQRVAAGGVAHFGPVSFVRLGLTPDEPERATMHDHTSGSPMASPMLFAWPEPAQPGTLPVTDATLRGLVPVASPAQALPARWEVTLGDWVGRWGDPATVDVTPPTAARPAPPTIRAVFVRAAAAGTAPASPGSVRVEIDVPPPSAPGALPLASLTLTVNGEPLPVELPIGATPHRATYVHVAPASSPGDTRRLHFDSWVTDASGTESDRVSAEVQADDARPVPPPVLAPRLLVSGRPGPAPDIAVRLTVRAVKGAAYYRFYTAAESTVRVRAGLGEGGGFRALPRALRAKELFDRRMPPREGFTLADTAPVDRATGAATGVLLLPSGTGDIVVVRAVPVTGGVDAYGTSAEGVEAPVGSTEAAYLVVPTDEVPPLPRVAAIADGPGHVTVSVEVSGAPAGMLGRLPGPIEARIVEAIDGSDPYYWPEVARIALADGNHSAGRFSASIPLDVPPWARLRLAASVRYAGESTVLPGADVVHDPDLTVAGPQPDLIVSPWGALAAPVTVDVPGAEPSVRSELEGADLRVFVDGLPSMSAGSSPFTAIVYQAADGGALTESGRHQLSADGSEFVLAGAGGGGLATTSAVVLEDPFGTTRAPVVLTSP
ncbi:MAG: hypothetical protein QM628_01850 [Propionicimonas sp.]